MMRDGICRQDDVVTLLLPALKDRVSVARGSQ